MTLVKPAPDAQVREEKQNKRTWPFPHPKHGKRWLILGVIALLFLCREVSAGPGCSGDAGRLL